MKCFQKVYCGHEYTVGSLTYALHVENGNQDIKDKIKWAKDQREKGIPTIPSTIEEELKYNPFMRVKESTVQKHAGASSTIDTMDFLRNEKNSFRPKS